MVNMLFQSAINLFRWQYFILLMFILLFSGCGKSGERKSLNKEEGKLEAKERQLQNWEEQLKLKEQELAKRQHRLDSLQNHSGSIYNPGLVGNWSITMQCIETTCDGSAIGDTKTEQWNISYQDNKVFVKASANKKLIRTYTGVFKENSLALSASQTPETDTHMDVTLSPHPTTEGLMEGQRVINQGGKCKVVYSIKAERL